eukprot:scaffold112895_cov14-Prasinocladus_malaysianus.AAC.1
MGFVFSTSTVRVGGCRATYVIGLRDRAAEVPTPNSQLPTPNLPQTKHWKQRTTELHRDEAGLVFSAANAGIYFSDCVLKN